MNNYNHGLRFAALSVMTLALGFFAIALSIAFFNQMKARHLLTVLQGLEVGITDESSARRLTAPFSNYSEQFIYDGQPAINFAFDNRSLGWLELAPYSDFRAFIVFKDGVVVAKQAAESAPACGCAAIVSEIHRGFGFADGVAPHDFPSHIVHGTLIPPAIHIFVRDDDTYPAQMRSSDWNLDLSCLTHFRGCQSATSFFAGVVPTPIPAEFKATN